MAKMGDRIAKVVCKRCGGHHRYRNENERRAEAPRARRAAASFVVGRSRARADADAASRSLPAFDPSKPPRPYAASATATPPASGSPTRSSASAWSPARRARARSRSCSPAGARVLACAKTASTPGPPGRRRRPADRRPPAGQVTRSRASARSPRGRAAASAWRARFGAGIPGSTATRCAGAPRLADGALVLVAGADGRPLARGFWDARSPIAVRVARRRPSERRRSAAAIERARRRGARAPAARSSTARETDAFRWIHGEADRAARRPRRRLRHARSSVRFDGGGARAFYREPAGAAARGGAARAGCRSTAIVERRPRGERRAPTASARCRRRHAPRRRDRGARERPPLRRRPRAAARRAGCSSTSATTARCVRTLARDRRVLNLFGYTGGFSIYAAAGGARETTTVDVAAPAIAAARRNFERNRLAARRRALRRRGRLRLPRPRRGGRRAVRPGHLRPAELRAQPPRAAEPGLRAYRRLHRLCAAVTAPGGILCAASCSSHVGREAFLATVRDGAREAGRRAADRARSAAPPLDHPVVPQFPEGDYLKFAVVSL